MKTTAAKPMSQIERYILLTFGVLLTAVGVYFFKFPNNFSTGGVSGLSLILGRVFPSPVLTPSAFVFIINMALLVVGFIFLGRSFAFSTVYCSVVLSLAVNIMERFWPLDHPLTNQPLLELCFAVLAAFGTTFQPEGNPNNDIGVPNTLFRLDDATEYAVVEMGMDHAGEIERLSRCARPSAGIITMIGVSHLENLGTRENILKAKREICTGLPDGAPLVLNADNDLLPAAQVPSRLLAVWFGIEAENADVRATDITAGANDTAFRIVDREYGSFAATIPTVGLHTVYDALAAYAAATRMGLDAARCAAALADYQTTGMRQHIVEHGGVTFIEDCYNASPDSMRAALSVLKELPNPRKIALLGDMLELGTASEEGHRSTGAWAADAGVNQLIAYGPCSAAMAEAAKAHGVATVHCQTAAEVLQYLRQFVRPGDAVLAKASHAMGLEQLLQDFYKELPQG